MQNTLHLASSCLSAPFLVEAAGGSQLRDTCLEAAVGTRTREHLGHRPDGEGSHGGIAGIKINRFSRTRECFPTTEMGKSIVGTPVG